MARKVTPPPAPAQRRAARPTSPSADTALRPPADPAPPHGLIVSRSVQVKEGLHAGRAGAVIRLDADNLTVGVQLDEAPDVLTCKVANLRVLG